MRVFDANWIEGLTARYAQLPEYQQPPLYRLATDPRWGEKRQRVESALLVLPPEKQPSVIQRLRDPDQFDAAYHELLVGVLLRGLGYEPEYEKRLEGKTPDWFVPARGDVPAFFVEVASVLASKERETEVRLWEELQFRVEQIEHYFDLEILARPDASPDCMDVKAILSFVEDWLDSLDPGTTTRTETVFCHADSPCIEFAALPRSAKGRGKIATCVAPPCLWIGPDRLRNILRKKLKKYGAAKALHVPLVIAVVPSFDSGFSVGSIIGALFGQPQFTIYLRDGKPIGERSGRDGKGIVTPRHLGTGSVVRNRRLSAVLWIGPDTMAPPRVIHNPHADLPLPSQSFPGVSQFTVVDRDKTCFKLDWVTP